MSFFFFSLSLLGLLFNFRTLFSILLPLHSVYFPGLCFVLSILHYAPSFLYPISSLYPLLVLLLHLFILCFPFSFLSTLLFLLYALSYLFTIILLPFFIQFYLHSSLHNPSLPSSSIPYPFLTTIRSPISILHLYNLTSSEPLHILPPSQKPASIIWSATT